jgi:hypothetical protein
MRANGAPGFRSTIPPTHVALESTIPACPTFARTSFPIIEKIVLGGGGAKG